MAGEKKFKFRVDHGLIIGILVNMCSKECIFGALGANLLRRRVLPSFHRRQTMVDTVSEGGGYEGQDCGDEGGVGISASGDSGDQHVLLDDGDRCRSWIVTDGHNYLDLISHTQRHGL